MARTRQSRLTYLDTHVVAWLYDGLLERLSTPAVTAIAAGRLIVSGMVELELQYLHEIGRLRPTARTVLGVLSETIAVRQSDIRFAPVIAVAGKLSWTRDPFDRLICAEAIVTGGLLISKDATILEHCEAALW